MALKWLRDNLRHLKFILWGVVAVFVLLVFVDWGAGRTGGSGGAATAVRVGDRGVSEAEFLSEMRRLDQRFSEVYGERWNEFKSQVDLAGQTASYIIDRELQLAEAQDAGIMVTASHNPARYNGYKVYWEDGAQVTPPHDKGIIARVRDVEGQDSVRRISEQEARSRGLLVDVGPELDEAYFTRIAGLARSRDLVDRSGEDVTIVYTPLHGTGGTAVPPMLERFGFRNVRTVPEQAAPDGDFPTVDAASLLDDFEPAHAAQRLVGLRDRVGGRGAEGAQLGGAMPAQPDRAAASIRWS